LAEFRCFRRVIFAVLDPRMAQIFGEGLHVPITGLNGEAPSHADVRNNPGQEGHEETKPSSRKPEADFRNKPSMKVYEGAKPVSRKEARRRKGAHYDDD